MDQTPSISEYVSALRRRVRTIVLAGLALSVVLGGTTWLLRGPQHRISYFIADSEERELVTLLGAPGHIIPAFNVQIMEGEVQLDLLNNYTERFDDDLIGVSYSASGSELIVSVIDNDKAVAATLANEILDRVVSRHRAEYDQNLDRVAAATSARVQQLLEQSNNLANLDTQSAGVQSYIVFSELIAHQRILAGIAQLELSTTRGILDPEMLGIPRKVNRVNPITSGALGLVLGLVLATGIVTVFRFFEARILVPEDIERAGFPLRFVETIATPTGSIRQLDLVGAATAMTANLALDEARSIQVFGIDDDDRFADIALGLESAIGSLGFNVERLDLTLDVLETHEFVEQVRSNARRSTGLLLVYTASASGPASTPFAVGANVDQTVLVGYCGKSRNASIRNLLREFEASAIICDGVVLVNA